MSGNFVRRLFVLVGALLLVIIMAVVALLLTQPASNANAASNNQAAVAKASAANAQAGAQKKADVSRANPATGLAKLKADVFDALLADAAKVLGLSDSALRDSLKSGNSLTDIAQAHHVSTQTLADAMNTVVQDRVAAAVKAGDVTQAQADEFLQGFPAAIQTFIADKSAVGSKGGKPDAGGKQIAPADERANMLFSAAINRLTALLGIDGVDLKIAIGNGQSPADQIQAHNISVQAAKDTMTTAAATRRDAAVKSGEWTYAQADEAWTTFTAQLDSFMIMKADKSGSK